MIKIIPFKVSFKYKLQIFLKIDLFLSHTIFCLDLTFSFSLPQILVFPAQLGDSVDERHLVHPVALVPPLLVHLHLRPAGHAALRRAVQLSRGNANLKLQHNHRCSPHCVPGEKKQILVSQYPWRCVSRYMDAFFPGHY